MIHKKLLMAFTFTGALCLALPAGVQSGALQKTIDPAALAEAIKKCPGLSGADAGALAVAAQNCPGLNGTLPGANCPDLTGPIDPVALAKAAQNCPALNPSLPKEARNCPALNGDLAAAAQNCPALGGGFIGPVTGQKNPAKLDTKIDKRMKRIVKALERNKNSAETLIQAARDAGADPKAVADLERMSQAFRQVFMSTVSPQQIIEGILSRQPATPEPPQGVILQAPDGSTWLISPTDQNPQPLPPQGMPPQAQNPGMQPPQVMPPQGMPPQFMPPQGMPPQGMPPAMGKPMPPQGMPPQFMPPQGMQPQGKPSAIGRPPKGTPPGMPPAINAPAQSVPQGQMIILEEDITPQYMPLWPTKDDLGKDGVLKYLERRNQAINSN